MSDITFLYVTAPNGEIAARMARALVQEKLVACANILAEMRSVYQWEGNVEIAAETPIIFKTTADAATAARDRIVALHPHEVPCVVALPIEKHGSNAGFLDWINDNVQP
ncbi:divalent-cation tolerance protein CutA [Hyphococcus lacteus]|uniref:Divalent-cation tolerance protein CutA n=1 Tax=Hyphococcus lacteus TaxID=3143536 RepID=A0ABV3Z5T3_9PROT